MQSNVTRHIYRKILNVIPRLLAIFKHIFLGGLYSGGLYSEGILCLYLRIKICKMYYHISKISMLLAKTSSSKIHLYLLQNLSKPILISFYPMTIGPILLG